MIPTRADEALAYIVAHPGCAGRELARELGGRYVRNWSGVVFKLRRRGLLLPAERTPTSSNYGRLFPAVDP